MSKKKKVEVGEEVEVNGNKETKVKVGEEITAGKGGKKAERKDIAIDPAELEQEEQIAESEPAVVPESTVTVRGTSVGGTRQMTKSEYDKWDAETNGPKTDDESE